MKKAIPRKKPLRVKAPDKNRKTAHALNNLLSGIMLSADFLLREIAGTINAQQKKHLKEVLAHARKIGDIIKKTF